MDLDIRLSERRALLSGEEVVLGARAFDLLAYLHSHADRVVTKLELLDHVWAGMLVEEGNLSVQIAGLRKALGREAIKTVPGVGYQLSLAPAEAAVEGPALPPEPSLVVLPFANLTGSEDLGHIVDAMVAELTNALSGVAGFFVISTTTGLTYKSQPVDLARVGQELGVRYVVEGSLQKAGPTLRVFVQLVEAETGHMIWRERFDGSMDDLFDLQDNVAAGVASAIEPTVAQAEATRAQARGTQDLRAYDLCMQAAPLATRLDRLDNLERALELLGKALEIDPDYTHAKAYICTAHSGALAARWWSKDKASAALGLAYDVLDSRTQNAFALAICGHHVAYMGHDFERGQEGMARSLRINPNSATALIHAGWLMIYTARPTEAIPLFERVRRLSPLHPQIGVATCGIGAAQLTLGNDDAALEALEQALAEYPEFATTRIQLIAVQSRLGNTAEAQRHADWLKRKVPHHTVSMQLEINQNRSPDWEGPMIAGLRATGFPE